MSPNAVEDALGRVRQRRTEGPATVAILVTRITDQPGTRTTTT